MSNSIRGDIARDELPQTRARLKFDQIDMMMVYSMRDHIVFLESLRELKPEHFNKPGEKPRRLIWAKTVQLYNKYNVMPSRSALEAEVLAAIEAEGDEMTFEMREEAVSLIAMAYEFETDVLDQHRQYGRDLLVQFLTERMVNDPLASLIQNASSAGSVLTDTGEVLNRLQATLSRVASLGSFAASPLLPSTGWRPEQAEYTSTGYKWLDDILGGGTNPGKVYGIFGPFGSFKTGFAVQLGISMAQVQYTIAKEKGSKPKMIVYIVYEGGEDEIRARAIATAAKMPKSRVIGHFTGKHPLSTYETPETYEVERRRRSNNPEDCLPESMRVIDAIERTSNFHIIDHSGSKKNPHAGNGYLPEIVAALERLVRETGMEIGAVIIDYVKLMVRRYMTANGIRFDQVRHYMGGLPDAIRRDVAERFGCSVWLLQQLNTEANKKAAGAAQHHSNASEAGDFGENLWFCFTLSAVDKAQGHTIQFNATKTRDTEGLSEPIILQIEGNENALVDARARYTIKGKKIVRRDIADAVSPTVGEAGRTQEATAEATAEAGIPSDDGKPKKPKSPSRVRSPGRANDGVSWKPPENRPADTEGGGA